MQIYLNKNTNMQLYLHFNVFIAIKFALFLELIL